ncbi:MAG: ribosomal RNA small subunit methyltransferase A [Chlamydiae bacterium]|nr:ribosomal RNA small subunit methyltransferase A [Chlamydiota bacterium]
MKISNPQTLKEFLSSEKIKAKKRSSQNFLIDGNIIRKIVKTAEINTGDIVLEVGPGPGALTEELLSKGAKVIAVEKDPELAKSLLRFQTPDRRLTVFEEDFLQFPLEKVLKEHNCSDKKIKVVANLPYHITTPILEILLPLNTYIETMTLMVQKEVATRFTASKGNKNYGSFTIFIQHYAKAKYCFTVEPSCFYPRPSVQSAIVRFDLLKLPVIEQQDVLFSMIRTAFSHRRKMLKSSLRNFYSPEKIESCLFKANLNTKARPEDLSRDEFIVLHQFLIS